jgi:acyl-CoA thioester hydrolase
MSHRVPAVPERVFTARVPLRWGDMDSLGHVNNVIVLRLLEEARVQFFVGLPPTGEHGFGVLAARHEIDYLKPLHYSAEPVEIRLWVERVGTSSFTVSYVVVDPAGEVVCAAKTVIVSIESATGRAVSIPQQLRKRAEEYLAA